MKLGFWGTNNSDLLCLQEENFFDLEVDWFGLNDMVYFSLRQSVHPFVIGLKDGRFVLRNFQEIMG